MNLKNYHIIKAHYSDSKVILTSERFKQRIHVPYDFSCNNTLEAAEKWLTEKGFELAGMAEGADCYYLISSTFKKLRKS